MSLSGPLTDDGLVQLLTPTGERVDHPDYTPTDADYMQWVGIKQCESYAKAYGLHEPTLAAEEAAVAAKRAKLESMK